MTANSAGREATLSPSGDVPGRAHSDLELFGLARGYLDWPRRDWLLTIDLEAFTPATVPLWAETMDMWTARSRAGGHRFSVFVSTEDLVRLRCDDEEAYRTFLAAMRRMADAGSTFHAHNHGVFDVDDGSRPFDPGPEDPPVPGYSKRPSMFYDVVRRQGRDLGEWLGTVFDQQRKVLDDAGIEQPRRLAFRAGGLDNGSSRADLEMYLGALRVNGVDFDSSATGGGFGTRAERLTSSYGRNVFALPGGLVEAAPCLMLDCGAPLLSRSWAGTVRRLVPQRRAWGSSANGLFVVVLHMDHLFHERPGRAYELFKVTDARVIEQRINRFFAVLDRMQSLLRFGSVIFEDMPGARAGRFERGAAGPVRAEAGEQPAYLAPKP